MDARSFRLALNAHGIDREVGDAIIDYVDDQKSDLVTNQKLELEMSKLRGELKTEMSELRGEIKTDMANIRTEFAEHKAHVSKVVLGSSGVLGVALATLMVILRFYPAAG
jgi:hypothetical protein